jgi:hypothetical protein
VAFEIGPRMNEKTWNTPTQGKRPAHRVESHSRTINGTRYVFGRITYETGQVAIQVIIPGRSSKADPDLHYWTNRDDGVRP